MRGVLSMVLIGCGANNAEEKDDALPADDADADTDADTDSDTDADTDTDTEEPCVAVVTGVEAVVVPSPVITPGTFDIGVTATFDVAVAETHDYTIEVDGETGATTLAADGLSMLWEGTVDDGLTFEVTATVCGVDTPSEFSTPSVGIQGSTFALVWDDLQIYEPTNASLLLTFIDGPRFLLAQPLALDMVTGLGEGRVTAANVLDPFGAPEPNCNLATVADADFSLDPELAFGAEALTVPIDMVGGTADVEGFRLVGRVSADGSRMEDVQIEGLIATEQVSPGADCNSPVISLLGATCLPCTISSTGSCMLYAATLTEALVVESDIAGFCP